LTRGVEGGSAVDAVILGPGRIGARLLRQGAYLRNDGLVRVLRLVRLAGDEVAELDQSLIVSRGRIEGHSISERERATALKGFTTESHEGIVQGVS
jgi:hypothetical protein